MALNSFYLLGAFLDKMVCLYKAKEMLIKYLSQFKCPPAVPLPHHLTKQNFLCPSTSDFANKENQSVSFLCQGFGYSHLNGMSERINTVDFQSFLVASMLLLWMQWLTLSLCFWSMAYGGLLSLRNTCAVSAPTLQRASLCVGVSGKMRGQQGWCTDCIFVCA